MKRNVNVWTEGSEAVNDKADPEVVTTAWSVVEGVEILSAEVFEGTMLVIRMRVPDSVRAQGDIVP